MGKKNIHRKGSRVRTSKMSESNEMEENLGITKELGAGWWLFQEQNKGILLSQMFYSLA